MFAVILMKRRCFHVQLNQEEIERIVVNIKSVPISSSE